MILVLLLQFAVLLQHCSAPARRRRPWRWGDGAGKPWVLPRRLLLLLLRLLLLEP